MKVLIKVNIQNNNTNTNHKMGDNNGLGVVTLLFKIIKTCNHYPEFASRNISF